MGLVATAVVGEPSGLGWVVLDPVHANAPMQKRRRTPSETLQFVMPSLLKTQNLNDSVATVQDRLLLLKGHKLPEI